MADADRIAAALRYQQEQNPADPLESFRSLAGLKSAYERRVQPIINNAMQTFSTGGAVGDLLRSYGEAAAPANAAVLKGMGMPYQGSMTAPREEGVTSSENFRAMGDPQQQFSGQLLGDPMNLAQPAGARLANALKFAKPDAMKMVKDLSMGAISPMDTWHGSPHRFPPTAKNPLGEFDPTKIGTGEGAQAYGVGAAYLAEAKDLAKHYRDVLAIDPRDSVNNVRAALSPTGNGRYWGSGENKAQLDDIYFEMKRHPNLQPYLNDSGFKKDIQKIINGTNPDGTVTDEAINILRRLDKTMPKPSGQLYKVDLADEQIPKMLDWDKPLNATPNGRAALDGLIPKLDKDSVKLLKQDADRLDGAGLVTWAQRVYGKDGASAYLQSHGIPGIRYLDQGSRTVAQPTYPGGFKISPPNTTVSGKWMVKGNDYNSKGMHFNSEAEAQKHLDKMFPDFVLPKTPQGTSNFVVFDPAHMNIIGRE